MTEPRATFRMGIESARIDLPAAERAAASFLARWGSSWTAAGWPRRRAGWRGPTPS